MADFDNTALNATIRELWDEKIQEARYATAVIANRVTNSSGIAKKKGDLIHVTIDQRYTVGTVSAAGIFSPQNYTPTTVDITLNQWEQVSIQVLDRAEAQAFWTPASVFPTRVGAAFGERYDAQLGSLWTFATQQVGSASLFDKSKVQEAMIALANANVPLTDLSLIVHPQAYWAGLMNEAQLVDANKTGLPKSALTTGLISTILGVPVYTSTNIVESGAPALKKNLLLHKSALAIAWQKNVEIERVRATANLTLADLFVAQSLYGFAGIRADHMVTINSAAS